ncbi:hypothetical protein BGX29_003165 [Mortierella sp. GBA35]|nr:hypothetical protein BGX29_003165 [Mortierella sp. GBA35]
MSGHNRAHSSHSSKNLLESLPKTSSTSTNGGVTSPSNVAEFGGGSAAPRSRSSTAVGLPPMYGSGPFGSGSGSGSGYGSGSMLAHHANNQHLWTASRLRSVSNSGPITSSNGIAIAAASGYANRPSVTTQQGSSSETAPSHSTSRLQPQPLQLQPRQSAGSAASLMEIYAQQQQLQQYSNQRAQLSPTQVQNMFIMRNSRSSPSLGAAAAAAGAVASATATATAGAMDPTVPLPGVMGAMSTRSDATTSSQESTLTTKDDSSSSATPAGQVTVMFEATSFSIQDPNHPNNNNSNNNPTIPAASTTTATPTSVNAMSSTSVASIPSLASASSSMSSISTAAPSPTFPGSYPGSAMTMTPKLSTNQPMPIDPVPAPRPSPL